MAYKRKTERQGLVKAHKIALEPTAKQANMMSRCAGYARVAQNRGVEIFYEGLDRDEWLDGYKIAKIFNAEKYELFEWCSELPQSPAKFAIKDNLDQAISRWGKHCKDIKHGNKPSRKQGAPKFKKYRDGKSFRIDNGVGSVSVKGDRLKCPIGKIKMRETLRFDGVIRKVHIKQEGRKWFAVIVVETCHQPLPPKKEGFLFGVDMGIRMLATIFNADTGIIAEISNLRLLECYKAKLRRLNKKLARSIQIHGKDSYSKRRDDTIRELNATHAVIKQIRGDLIHKATTALVMSAREIRVETLNISGMMKNSRLARALSDACMGQFLRTLEYKCEWYGVKFVKIDRWYPSTQICSECGHQQKLSLSCEIYKCANNECAAEKPRDWNASINIALYEENSGTDSSSEADENFTLVESLPLLV